MSRLHKAREAIDEVFLDTSVDPATTRSQLEELAADIEIKLESLPDSDEE